MNQDIKTQEEFVFDTPHTNYHEMSHRVPKESNNYMGKLAEHMAYKDTLGFITTGAGINTYESTSVTPLKAKVFLNKAVPGDKNVATKFDAGKTDWSLVPFEALEGMTQVLTFGAEKYSRNNWRENGGFKWLRVCSSTLRHMFAFMAGQDNDPETGLSHIYHAQCNLLFLAYYVRTKKEFSKNDDRK